MSMEGDISCLLLWLLRLFLGSRRSNSLGVILLLMDAKVGQFLVHSSGRIQPKSLNCDVECRLMAFIAFSSLSHSHSRLRCVGQQ